jgi:hypothetical protein
VTKERGRRGDGTIRARGDTWEVAIDAGSQPAQRCKSCRRLAWVERGRPRTACPKCFGDMGEIARERRRVFRRFDDEDTAREALLQLALDVRKGRNVLPADVSFATYVESEWRPRAARRVRSTTLFRYSGLLADHVLAGAR